MRRWMAAFVAPLAVGACVTAIGDQDDRDALAAETLDVMDRPPLVRQRVVASPALPRVTVPAPPRLTPMGGSPPAVLPSSINVSRAVAPVR